MKMIRCFDVVVFDIMFCYFLICDFVIVVVFDFEFDSGFFVFFGEIGVGKLILIDVFVFVFGECVDVSVVCIGCGCVDIMVEFMLYDCVVCWFDEYVFDVEDIVMLCCVIDVNGCLCVFINGISVMFV